MDLTKAKKLKIFCSPGCYQFIDKQGKIIYIGKAVNLRSRIISYWSRSKTLGRDRQKSAYLSPAKFSMVNKIKKIKWIETDSEVEALLLEANLIKKYQPTYNITLRDDKRYVYIKVSTEEEWPRVFITRKLEKTGKYFGPFVSAEAVRQTLKVIRKIWPFRSCVRLSKKACLYYQIGKCLGMCENKITRIEYKKIVRQIIMFLEGKKNIVSKKLEVRIKNLEKRKTEKIIMKLRRRLSG